MQTPKTSSSSPSEVPKKVSPRVIRQLKISAVEPNSATSSNQTSRTPTEKSPKVAERKSPRNPISELKISAVEPNSATSSNQTSKNPTERSPKVAERKSPRSSISEKTLKKHPSKLSQLEAQLSQLKEELKKAKDELISSESWKRQAQQDAEDVKQQLLAMSSKLEASQQELQELSATQDARVLDLQKSSQEKETTLEAVQHAHALDSAALASANSEIIRLKNHLESEVVNAHDDELVILKENLEQTLSMVEDMNEQIRNCKESEAQAHALVSETLIQLENAKVTGETLRLDCVRSNEAYNSVVSELEQSRACVNLLKENGKIEITKLYEALEAAEEKSFEEQIQSWVELKCAYEILDKLKLTLDKKTLELETEIEKTKADIEELKANLMDKETELQCISEENDVLIKKLENTLSVPSQHELEIAEMKASLMDKETELQNISEENELLKIKLNKKSEAHKNNYNNSDDEVSNDQSELLKASEQDTLTKLNYMIEEAEKSQRKATRVSEQLDAAQATNAEMEAELRRMKVQSDQWRKAAEAAAAMISAGQHQGKFMNRNGSLDSNYNPVIGSPYSEDMEDDEIKKKNGNVLKKIGVLWKKPNK